MLPHGFQVPFPVTVTAYGYLISSTTRESFAADTPLLCNQSKTRISKRRVQMIYRDWQCRAGFDRHYPFHALRHTAVTHVYRASRDLFLAQRFARHQSPLTTVVYTHPSDEELFEGTRGIPC